MSMLQTTQQFTKMTKRQVFHLVLVVHSHETTLYPKIVLMKAAEYEEKSHAFPFYLGGDTSFRGRYPKPHLHGNTPLGMSEKYFSLYAG